MTDEADFFLTANNLRDEDDEAAEDEADEDGRRKASRMTKT